jgi:hypothetical protein
MATPAAPEWLTQAAECSDYRGGPGGGAGGRG